MSKYYPGDHPDCGRTPNDVYDGGAPGQTVAQGSNLATGGHVGPVAT
jgi:hypothetical protein